jgi:hypothetical protein
LNSTPTRGLLQQRRRGAPQEQEPAGGIGAVDQNAQGGKRTRMALDFIDDNEPSTWRKRRHRLFEAQHAPGFDGESR